MKKKRFTLKRILLTLLLISIIVPTIIVFKGPLLAVAGVYDLNPYWGLGKHESKHVSNNRDYDWYVDQSFTGLYSKFNSGPSCAVMAAKWYNLEYTKNSTDEFWENKTVIEAREFSPNNVYGKWSKEEIMNYLSMNNIKHELYAEANEDILKEKLDDGGILILNLNMRHVEPSPEDELLFQSRVGKVNNEFVYHYIILKGYRIVDNNLFFEVYDPANYSSKYTNGEPKSKDRYYRSEQILDGIKDLFNEFILIPKPENN